MTTKELDDAVQLAKMALEHDAELASIESATGLYAGRQHLPARLARALLAMNAEIKRLRLGPEEVEAIRHIKSVYQYPATGRVPVSATAQAVLDKLIAEHDQEQP